MFSSPAIPMANKTFYLKLGNCLNPLMSVLNSNGDHALSTNNIIKYKVGATVAASGLEIQQHADAVRAKMARIGLSTCRRLIIHSHGNGVGKLSVKDTGGTSRAVSAAKVVSFLAANTPLGEEGKYLNAVFVLACGIGNAAEGLDVPWIRDFASRLATAQGKGVTVYGPYYWVDLRYGSLFLYKGAHVDSVAELTAESNVTNGSMGSAANSDTNLDNWVSYTSNFKQVVAKADGEISSESATPE